MRRQLTLTGVVQGVGFRPQVARLAARWPITGICGNDEYSVFIEAQGTPGAVAAFFAAVQAEPPPLADILSAKVADLAPVPAEPQFKIVPSRSAGGARTLVPPDAASCRDCLADIADPMNRRFAYPFTTCTNCGPRLSIICDVPYDRPLTTMAAFEMCPACASEYRDPDDRRFHAQPISCFDCGPNLWLEVPGEPRGLAPADLDRRAAMAQAIAQARARLARGEILATKGIGGYTLMCDARDPDAVARLRARKRRPDKPLAVMVGSLATARGLADLSTTAQRVLTSRAAPIVLAPLRAGGALGGGGALGAGLADGIAPGLDEIGLMLPYSPLHRLLLAEGDVIVATSANSSTLPLTYREDDARADLGHIVDAFLMHNRQIEVPVEDSVMATAGEAIRPIRRSRGYAPLPVPLPAVRRGEREPCVLAVGGELKATFALTRDGLAFLSAHIGDLGSLETQRAYERSVAQLVRAHRRTPELVVVDKHPGYASRAWGHAYAAGLGVKTLEIQHHHAHALSLVAEHQRTGDPLTAVVLDGTGYGDDGTIWGGEVLHLGSDPLEVSRGWHLPGFWLPGGDSAIRHPWKSAVALLWEYGLEVPDGLWQGVPGGPTAAELGLVSSQLASRVAVTRTTSAGRLFDAVAALLGICAATYEGQAAMQLEALARTCHHAHPPEPDLADLTSSLLSGSVEAAAPGCLARTFHSSLAALIANAVTGLLPRPATVGLTGGVFANRILTAELTAALVAAGHEVLGHTVVPCNDGGLALGQALAGVLHIEGTGL